jgi:hypothetical protein
MQQDSCFARLFEVNKFQMNMPEKKSTISRYMPVNNISRSS